MEEMEELKNKLELIKGERFNLAMKDIWFAGDFARNKELELEQKNIENELRIIKAN